MKHTEAECFIRWIDQHGAVHETSPCCNFIIALHDAWKAAKHLDLQIKRMIGVVEYDVIEIERSA